MLTDPVALGAALGLADAEAADAVTLSRLLLDYSNAVIGLAAGRGPGRRHRRTDRAEPWLVTARPPRPAPNRVRRADPAGPRAG